MMPGGFLNTFSVVGWPAARVKPTLDDREFNTERFTRDCGDIRCVVRKW